MDDHDPRLAQALARYQVLSAYLTAELKRGQRRPFLEQLARRTWIGPDGEPLHVTAETIRKWAARYRHAGLDGLMDKPHPHRGSQALTPEQVELFCRLKREVPERSLERLIAIAEQTGLVGKGLVRRSTLHRALRAHDLSARKIRVPDARDLDRFEADAPNDLWQSDMLVGPWLPDPQQPGKVRRAHLYAFLDDHSRLLLAGRFSFKEDLPALELVFRQALRRFGRPRRLYYDNGQVYRAEHMAAIVAALGIHRVIFTRPYRPMGHGKIEAFNRLVRSSFLAELKASKITTLDALNEAFLAWVDHEYNQRIHGQTGQKPRDRWRTGLDAVRFVEEEALRQAFLWREVRTPDKTGVLSLFATRYQVGPKLARKRVEVRFDPEALHEVEIWQQDRFVERARPLEIQAHRRPRDPENEADGSPSSVEPGADRNGRGADWLAHLMEQRRRKGPAEPTPQQLADQAKARRAAADLAVLALLQDRLAPGAVDPAAVRAWLARYGPLDPETTAAALDRLLQQGHRQDHPATLLLDALRPTPSGGPS